MLSEPYGIWNYVYREIGYSNNIHLIDILKWSIYYPDNF